MFQNCLAHFLSQDFLTGRVVVCTEGLTTDIHIKPLENLLFLKPNPLRECHLQQVAQDCGDI